MIVIRRRPYATNFAGNAVLYELYDADAVNSNEIAFEVRVLFASYESNTAPAEIAIVPLTPFKGVAQIDISNLLNSYLEYYTPLPSISGSQVTGLQTGKFFIHFRRAAVQAPWDTSEENSTCTVVKGGVNAFHTRNNNFFNIFFPATKPFFTWQLRRRLASLTEPIYLCWLNTTYTDATPLKVKVNITYTDSTTREFSYDVSNPGKKNYCYYLPVGANQLDLETLDPTKTIWYWDVVVSELSGTLASEKFTYELDNRNDYNQQFLLYRNSLGGLDTIRIRGVIETNISLEGQDMEVTSPVDWQFNDGLLPILDSSTPHKETISYKGDTGFLTKEEQDRLRDIFLHREVYTFVAGILTPAKLLTKNYKLRSSIDKLFSLAIEWSVADAGSYHYTPVNVNVSIGGQDNTVCNAVINVTAGTTMYSGSNATVAFNYVVTGSATGIQYKVPGYVDDWQNIPFALTGVINYTVLAGNNVTINMRTVCSNGTLGVIAMRTVNTSNNGGAFNSTIRNNTSINLSYKLLRNGILIAAGTLDGGAYDGFVSTAGRSSYELQLEGLQPSTVYITNALGIQTPGEINGSIVKWPTFITLIAPQLNIEIF